MKWQIFCLTSGTEPWTRHVGVKHSDVWQCEQLVVVGPQTLWWRWLHNGWMNTRCTAAARGPVPARGHVARTGWSAQEVSAYRTMRLLIQDWLSSAHKQNLFCYSAKQHDVKYFSVYQSGRHAVRPGRNMCTAIDSQLCQIHPFSFLRVLKLFFCCSDLTSRDLKLLCG